MVRINETCKAKSQGFAPHREQLGETGAQMAEISKFQENCSEYRSRVLRKQQGHRLH